MDSRFLIATNESVEKVPFAKLSYVICLKRNDQIYIDFALVLIGAVIVLAIISSVLNFIEGVATAIYNFFAANFGLAPALVTSAPPSEACVGGFFLFLLGIACLIVSGLGLAKQQVPIKFHSTFPIESIALPLGVVGIVLGILGAVGYMYCFK